MHAIHASKDPAAGRSCAASAGSQAREERESSRHRGPCSERRATGALSQPPRDAGSMEQEGSGRFRASSEYSSEHRRRALEMKLLIDTNRLSDALAEVDEVLDQLENAESLHVPVIALGEIRSGFRKGRRPAENEKRLSWFL